MSNILSSKDFGLKIYNRFPPKYREDDVSQKYALKRFLESLSDGGFKYAIDDINGILNLIDPDKVNAKILPILFKQYGLEIFNGIPEEYLRYLLPRLGEVWSKKGSLSAVEYVTASISGIKTITEVDYDENGNPLIDVKLEMDYNIGSYVPDTEQFNRLLKNFMPFYCDFTLVYSYMFYESQILWSKDLETMDITETKDETSRLQSSESDYLKSKISQIVSEKGSFNSLLVDNYIDKLKLPIIAESSKLKGSEVIEKDHLSVVARQEDAEVSSTEVLNDNISIAVNSDSGTLVQSVLAKTNVEQVVLNHNFYTNPWFNCDKIIHSNGVVNTLFY